MRALCQFNNVDIYFITRLVFKKRKGVQGKAHLRLIHVTKTLGLPVKSNHAIRNLERQRRIEAGRAEMPLQTVWNSDRYCFAARLLAGRPKFFGYSFYRETRREQRAHPGCQIDWFSSKNTNRFPERSISRSWMLAIQSIHVYSGTELYCMRAIDGAECVFKLL